MGEIKTVQDRVITLTVVAGAVLAILLSWAISSQVDNVQYSVWLFVLIVILGIVFIFLSLILEMNRRYWKNAPRKFSSGLIALEERKCKFILDDTIEFGFIVFNKNDNRKNVLDNIAYIKKIEFKLFYNEKWTRYERIDDFDGETRFLLPPTSCNTNEHGYYRHKIDESIEDIDFRIKLKLFFNNDEEPLTDKLHYDLIDVLKKMRGLGE